MLSPDYLAHIPDAACALWQQVEEDILADIARRLAKMGEITDTALWQVKRLEQVRLFRLDVVRRLKKASGQSEALIRQLLQLACTQALQADDAAHEAAGQTVSAINDSIALRNLLTAGAKQTNGTMANITATTANTATGQFERALDRAWLQTASGAFDYKTAVRRCVADLASTGLEAVRYPSGHVDTLEVAVRRAVVTGVNQSACRLQMERCKEVKCDLVEVTAHVGARPSHAQWQGKIYSISGKHPKYPPLSETGYGTGAGLGGWNCRHNMFPFWEGISEPQYTSQRLAELDARNIEYKGKQYNRYEINQMQRSRERRVRRWKRQYAMEEAAGLDSTQTAVWLKKARVDLEHFTRDTGGRVDSARVGVHGFGRSQASKAAWTARKELEKYSKIRYHKDGTIVVTDDWKDRKKPSIPKRYKPNAVLEIQTIYRNGRTQIDRTIYDSKGAMWKQIHSGAHNRPDKHPYGKNGEHAHVYIWEKGAISNRLTRDLDEQERKEHADILRGDVDG